jgi:acyl-CoA thioesterase I
LPTAAVSLHASDVAEDDLSPSAATRFRPWATSTKRAEMAEPPRSHAMRRRSLLQRLTRAFFGLTLLSCAAVIPVTSQAAATTCSAPRDLLWLQAPLPRTAQRVAAHQPLTIVAIGSSSTEGIGASSPARSYPRQLEGELRGRFAEVPVTVLNKGVGGEVAGQTLERFTADVLEHKPDLVIWQVGSNDAAMQDLDLAAYEQLVRGGIERLKAAGVDVLILDLQYAPMVLERSLSPRVEQILLSLAEQEAVPVFQRFAVMRHWLDSGQLDFRAMLSADGLHMNDFSYGCLARLMATAITDKTALPVMASRR